MLDCGAGTVHALARFGLPWQDLTHLFVSHFHVDHIGELPAMMFAFKWGMNKVRSDELCIVGPKGLNEVVQRLDDALGPRLFETRFPLSVKTLEPGSSMELGSNANLSVFKTPHNEESLAVKIECEGESIGYTGDTAYNDDVADFFQGVDILISECSYLTPHPNVRHLTVEEVAKLAARADAGCLIVTHCYFEVDEAELEQRISERFKGVIVVGRDGRSVSSGTFGEMFGRDSGERVVE